MFDILITAQPKPSNNLLSLREIYKLQKYDLIVIQIFVKNDSHTNATIITRTNNVRLKTKQTSLAASICFSYDSIKCIARGKGVNFKVFVDAIQYPQFFRLPRK